MRQLRFGKSLRVAAVVSLVTAAAGATVLVRTNWWRGVEYGAASTSTPPPSVAPAVAEIPGRRTIYSFSLTTSTQQAEGALEGRALGNVVVSVPQSAQGLEHWQLADVETFARQQGQPELRERLDSQRADCVVRRGGDGRPVELWFAYGTKPETRKLLEHLLSVASFAASPAAGTASWEATETDATGRYRASYAVRGDGVERRKIEYVSDAARAASLKIVESQAHARITAGSLVGVDTKERVSFHDGKIEATSSTTLQRVRDPQATVSADVLELHEQGVLYRFGSASLESSAERDLNVSRGLDATQLIDQLRTGASRERRSETLQQLSAVARAQPKTVEIIASRLNDNDDQLLSGLCAALGGAGSARAAELLDGVARDVKRSAMVRVQATDALGDTNMPPQIAVAHLSALLDDEVLRGKAGLTLGAVIFYTRDQAPEAAASGERALVARYRAPGSDRVSWLAALGNAGSSAILPDIKNFAKENDTMVRAELVFAARHVRSPDVDAIVQAGLKDKVDRVRFKAAQACALWVESHPCAGLASAVEREPVAANREVMLPALARGATTPEARARAIKVARAVLARNPDDRTRKMVEGLVAALSEPPAATATSGYAFGMGVNQLATSGGGKP